MEERKFHINALELKAAKLASMSFTVKERDTISLHICMDKMTALSYLINENGRRGRGAEEGRENQKPGVDSNEQRNLAIPFEMYGHNYCRILTRVNESRSRQGIQADKGFQ